MNHSCDTNAYFPLLSRSANEMSYKAIALRDIVAGKGEQRYFIHVAVASDMDTTLRLDVLSSCRSDLRLCSV